MTNTKMTDRECLIMQVEVMIDIAIKDIENPLNRAFGPLKYCVMDHLKQMKTDVKALTNDKIVYELGPELRQILTNAWRGFGH